ncbi:MAG: ABC transporter permease [Acidobacteriota bacterium]
MSTLLQDLRISLRMLRRNPGLTLAACLSLALGIGANAAIFSIVNGLLLKPLPYLSPERLAILWESDSTQAGRRMGPSSEATFRDWRRDARSFQEMGAILPTSLSLTGQDLPEALFTHQSTHSYFTVLGVKPELGRTWTEEEEARGARLAVLSHALWQRRFGGDPALVGRAVELDGEPYQVIGVLPADFRGPVEITPVQIWVPLPVKDKVDRKQRQMLVYGRLAGGVSVQSAREEVARLTAELVRRYPEEMQGRGGGVEQLQEVFVGDIRPALLILLGAGGFLLLIVCSNVAHLLLVRALSRQREMAVRTALGAAPRQILRQLFTESLLLALAGAAVGLGLARLALALVKTLVPARFDLPRLDAVEIDGRVLLATFAVAFLTALAFGLMPARMAFSQASLGEGVSVGSTRATGNRKRGLLRAALVVTEVALVLVLLIGTGLMAKTFLSLGRQEIAQDPGRVLVLRTGLRGPKYDAPEAKYEFFRRALETIREVPGVERAAGTDVLLLGPRRGGERFLVEGAPAPAPGSEPVVQVQVVTPEYFETLGTPLVKGRTFTDDDRQGAPPVALVNQLFAETWLQGREALGQDLAMVEGGGEVRRIVGVVQDARIYISPPEPAPTVYIPLAQKPAKVMTFAVRTRSDPEALSAKVQEAIARQDPLMSTFGIMTLRKSQADADWQSRFSLVLLGVFASLALVLAVTGIYAVISSGVAERTREFGVRMAFGARPADLLSLVLRSGLRQAALGLAFGLAASLVAVRILESQLYGVAATDLPTYVTLSALLAAVVLVACCVPAWRASRVDPAITLRQE